jgi:hypothetical protein
MLWNCIITISVPVLRVVSYEGCVVQRGCLKVRAVGVGRSSVQ